MLKRSVYDCKHKFWIFFNTKFMLFTEEIITFINPVPVEQLNIPSGGSPGRRGTETYTADLRLWPA